MYGTEDFLQAQVARLSLPTHSCAFEYSVARWEGGVSCSGWMVRLELSLGDGLKIPGEPGTPEMFEL